MKFDYIMFAAKCEGRLPFSDMRISAPSPAYSGDTLVHNLKLPPEDWLASTSTTDMKVPFTPGINLNKKYNCFVELPNNCRVHDL